MICEVQRHRAASNGPQVCLIPLAYERPVQVSCAFDAAVNREPTDQSNSAQVANASHQDASWVVRNSLTSSLAALRRAFSKAHQAQQLASSDPDLESSGAGPSPAPQTTGGKLLASPGRHMTQHSLGTGSCVAPVLLGFQCILLRTYRRFEVQKVPGCALALHG